MNRWLAWVDDEDSADDNAPFVLARKYRAYEAAVAARDGGEVGCE